MYAILETTQSEPDIDGNIIVRTLVKLDFLDEPLLIPHFAPKDQDEIILGIENRYQTELKKQP